jgi:hypothetical protein
MGEYGCPLLYVTLLKVSFKAGLQTIPLRLELLGALAYEVLNTGFLFGVWTYIDGTWVYDAGFNHQSRHITTLHSECEFGLYSMAAWRSCSVCVCIWGVSYIL